MSPSPGPLSLLAGDAETALEPGMIGVVMARAGVGKSACLVHLGLGHLQRGNHLLHLALGQELAGVEASYGVRLDRRLGRIDPLSRAQRHAELARRRLIVAFPDSGDPLERMTSSLQLADEGMGLQPRVVLFDGYAWERDGIEDELVALRRAAEAAEASVWMTATTLRSQSGDHPSALPPACADVADLIDLAVYLEPRDDKVYMRVLQDRRERGASDPEALLDFRAPRRSRRRPARRPRVSGTCTLISGGAEGAEATFGVCAEEHGLDEMTFSFAGHELARKRGLVVLPEAELLRGDVSRSWLSDRMGRSYPDRPEFQKVLQTIWHQVAESDEVFAVGAILDDGTVKGGTGWAVELARMWERPVFVFDQVQSRWFGWDGEAWARLDQAPQVSSQRFCGTGTRHLGEDGKRAIRELFQVSFGP